MHSILKFGVENAKYLLCCAKALQQRKLLSGQLESLQKLRFPRSEDISF